MWKTLNQNVVPERPGPEVKTTWLLQHSAKLIGAEVIIGCALQKERQSRVDPNYPYLSAREKVDLAGAKQQVKELMTEARASKGNIASDFRRLRETYIIPLFFVLPEFGLQRWAPDVFEGSTSRYNQIHETIAIATFQNLARGYAYAPLKPLVEFFENTAFLQGIYRCFVFDYMMKKQKRERNNPGILAKHAVSGASRKRRAEVRGTPVYEYHTNRALIALSDPSPSISERSRCQRRSVQG